MSAVVSTLSYEVEIVVRCNPFKSCTRIGLQPFFRRLVPLLHGPFTLETEQPAIALFYIVNLFPIVCTPKINIAVYPGVRSFFQSFGYDEVLPQRAGVIAGVKQVVLADDRVANPAVQEVVFCLAGHLVAQIAAEPPQPNNDESLFQDIQMSADCFHIQIDLGGQFIQGYFAPYLKGDQFQEIQKRAG